MALLTLDVPQVFAIEYRRDDFPPLRLPGRVRTAGDSVFFVLLADPQESPVLRFVNQDDRWGCGVGPTGAPECEDPGENQGSLDYAPFDGTIEPQPGP